MSSGTSSTAVFYTPITPTGYESIKVGDCLEMLAVGNDANLDYNHAIVEVRERRGGGVFYVLMIKGPNQGSYMDWTIDGINWAFKLIGEWDI